MAGRSNRWMEAAVVNQWIQASTTAGEKAGKCGRNGFGGKDHKKIDVYKRQTRSIARIKSEKT